MPSLPFSYDDFHGGLNTKNAPYLLTDNEARDLSNVQGTIAGAIVKRNGLVTFAVPPVTLNSLFAYEGSPGSLVAAGSTALYSINSGGVMQPIKTGVTDGVPWEWIQSQTASGQGPLYGMNGIDAPQQWSGTGLTANWTATSGSVPNGKYMLLAANRIWVTGVPANPSRVYFSDLIPVNNGPITWPAANVSIFDENDGYPITGIGHVGPYILVTKARTLYVITDMNTGDARQLADGVGCISHRSIVSAPEGTYFLAETRGVFLTNGSTVKEISDQIQPTTDLILTRTQAAGVRLNGHYYLSVNLNGAANDTVLDYDSTLGSWWKHSFGSAQFAVWHPAGVSSLFSAKGTDAIVDQCFAPGVTVDNGQPFTWMWRGPWQSPSFYRRRRFPTPYFRKRFRQIRYDGYGTVDFSLGTDFSGEEVLRASNVFMQSSTQFGDSDGSAYGGDGLFGDFPSVSRARAFSLGVYNAISVVFSGTSSTADAVTSYVLVVVDRRDLMF